MTQADIRAKLEGAIDYLKQNPADARYTDSHATARLIEPDGLKVAVEGPDGASVTTDMVASVGGTNEAPSPGWYFRAAQASAVATLIGMAAAMRSIDLEEAEVTVDSESDDWGILGIGDGTPDAKPAGPLSVRVHVKIRATPGATKEQLEGLANWAIDHTPALDAIKRAVPVNVEIETN